MNINQHNYEEFFLLYADGELSVAEKQAVDQFVAENPSLAAELVLFLDMKLDAESLVFEDKESLYRNGADEITVANQETYFLLYVDNELNAKARNKVETYVLQHPASQELFTELKQTKLVREEILFPDKASLYQKEKTDKPVFYIRLQRLAAAAVVTGLAILAWNILPKSNSFLQKLALNKTATNSIIETPLNNIGSGKNDDLKKTTATILQPVTNLSERVAETDQTKNSNTEQAVSLSNPVAVIQNNETTSALKREDVISIPNETKTYSQSILVSNNVIASANTTLTNIVEASEASESIAEPAIYRELDTDDENKSFYLGTLEINKDKFRGLFRKAGSILRNKSKTDEEKTETTTPSNERTFK